MKIYKKKSFRIAFLSLKLADAIYEQSSCISLVKFLNYRFVTVL